MMSDFRLHVFLVGMLCAAVGIGVGLALGSVASSHTPPPVVCEPVQACEVCEAARSERDPWLEKRPAPVRPGTEVSPSDFIPNSGPGQ